MYILTTMIRFRTSLTINFNHISLIFNQQFYLSATGGVLPLGGGLFEEEILFIF